MVSKPWVLAVLSMVHWLIERQVQRKTGVLMVMVIFKAVVQAFLLLGAHVNHTMVMTDDILHDRQS